MREWQALCRPHGVPVYPGFDASLPNASQWQGGCVGPEPMEEKNVLTTTAIASRYHHHGADGSAPQSCRTTTLSAATKCPR
eukprot:COSAG04_NODE_255_length_18797_cov_46.325968_15_plen_81_part_00